ncbi:uncharacterized protein LOC127750875 [Frankliniella occidentalis]|uniref:Uncharacterized protein LOC127750875 n=1 Tax=Frankliniella occidentalis TaxID=133901 RepID=A0A9C6X5D6_FRAOC|nr:uncharacterized protein LOC127750875 [Frankliniella occidentalis]
MVTCFFPVSKLASVDIMDSAREELFTQEQELEDSKYEFNEDWMESFREELSAQQLEDSVYAFQNEDLHKKVAGLKNLVRHLGWHCFVYRRALAKLPNGMATLDKTEREVLNEQTPPCSSCEKDELLLPIQQLKSSIRKVCVI